MKVYSEEMRKQVKPKTRKTMDKALKVITIIITVATAAGEAIKVLKNK